MRSKPNQHALTQTSGNHCNDKTVKNSLKEVKKTKTKEPSKTEIIFHLCQHKKWRPVLLLCLYYCFIPISNTRLEKAQQLENLLDEEDERLKAETQANKIREHLTNCLVLFQSSPAEARLRLNHTDTNLLGNRMGDMFDFMKRRKSTHDFDVGSVYMQEEGDIFKWTETYQDARKDQQVAKRAKHAQRNVKSILSAGAKHLGELAVRTESDSNDDSDDDELQCYKLGGKSYIALVDASEKERATAAQKMKTVCESLGFEFDELILCAEYTDVPGILKLSYVDDRSQKSRFVFETDCKNFHHLFFVPPDMPR